MLYEIYFWNFNEIRNREREQKKIFNLVWFLYMRFMAARAGNGEKKDINFICTINVCSFSILKIIFISNQGIQCNGTFIRNST